MGRTTSVTAHKLSTIGNADVIVVMNGGCVVEKGHTKTSSTNQMASMKN